MPKRKPRDPDRSPDLPHDWIGRHIDQIANLVYHDPIDLTTWQYRRAQLVDVGQYEKLDADWSEISPGDTWGGPDVTAYFRKTITLPATHADENSYLDIDLDGGETQLAINGRLWQGLDYYRSLAPLGEFAQAGAQLELTMEAFIINYPYDERRHDERDFHKFTRARLIRRDPVLDAFVHDARFVLDAYLTYWREDRNFELEEYLRHHLEAACRHIPPILGDRETAQKAAVSARNHLQTHIFQSDLLRQPGTINVCAHSHLDIVYLWPIKETLRKNCRSITNTLSLMREFPDYLYSYSQPYLYETLKEMYPAVYDEVKQRIAEGRWEVIGGLYIEPDGNLLGPESWVRQILFGQRYLQEEFGLRSETCWLPDVFGVNYALPQILRKGGIRFFTTAKLNIWNDTNVFPHDTFRWRGPDGSEVITHFPPTHFAQDFTFSNLRRHWRDDRQRQTAAENLFIYGWGDGGGGPTREMVETSLRSQRFPDLPQTKISHAEPFFRSVAAKADRLPVWDDELYMEGHRGTYTSKGDLKRLNRKAELLYRDVEMLSAFAAQHGGPRVQARLNEGWKLILLNQFHDTLPGTHVPVAVPDIKRDYAKIFEIGESLQAELLTFLAAQQVGEEGNLLLLNTLSWQRGDLVETAVLSHPTVHFPDGSSQPVQHYNGRSYFPAPALPPLGWTTATPTNGATADQPNVATFADNIIETPLYRLELNEDGTIGRLFDKTNRREVLAGAGNQFQLFEDDPGRKFSAWDIAYHFEEHHHPVQQLQPWTLVTNGPHFAVFSSRWQMLNGTLEQEIWLFANDPRIEFRTRAEWRDSRKLLKVAFPLAVRSRTATYDLPFAHIERPTHRNTSWEQAKFEVCGHKWADMSEGDYGVALLNDCKYGYDAKENVLRLSLLRSPVRPSANSDIGSHEFSYALLPHAGGWREAQVARHAYAFNIPALATAVSAPAHAPATMPQTGSLLTAVSDSLIVENIKQAEDGNGLILRIFDSHGSRQPVVINVTAPLAAVEETNLLEEPETAVSLNSSTQFTIQAKPYEIKTHRLTFKHE